MNNVLKNMFCLKSKVFKSQKGGLAVWKKMW